MVVPNALIVGVPKAGTTALFNAMSTSPEVCGSLSKETHYFSPLRYGEPLTPISAYEAEFSHHVHETIILEATPSYFYGGRTLATGIKNVSPGSRVIVILRDPRTRALSWWRFARSRGFLTEDIDFEAYVAICRAWTSQPEDTLKNLGWRGLSGGLYDHWLPAWRDVFGEALTVIFYEDLRQSPAKTVEQLGRHLGVDLGLHSIPEQNVTTEVRFMPLQHMALGMNRLGETWWRGHPKVKRLARAAYYRMNRGHQQPEISRQVERLLDDYFAGTLLNLHEQGLTVPSSWRSTLPLHSKPA